MPDSPGTGRLRHPLRPAGTGPSNHCPDRHHLPVPSYPRVPHRGRRQRARRRLYRRSNRPTGGGTAGQGSAPTGHVRRHRHRRRWEIRLAANASQLDEPTGVALDTSGDLFIADSANCRIQMVPPHTSRYDGQQVTAGDMYTVAGDGVCGSAHRGDAAVNAQVWDPVAVAVDPEPETCSSPTTGTSRCWRFPTASGHLLRHTHRSRRPADHCRHGHVRAVFDRWPFGVQCGFRTQ